MSDFEPIFSQYIELYKIHKEKQPYHFNILDEQQGHIVENSHTNILMKVLAYKNQYGYVFLKDFCESFFPALSGTDFEAVQFRREENRIDGLIYKQNDFAIIIENKVNHARNQKEQLKGYIQCIAQNTTYFENEKEAYKNIWVMYLTRDGIEKPDEASIEFMKDERIGICYVDSDKDSLDGERYFAANYSDDIYPWLKEKVLPMIPYKDGSLKYGLLQYIDFLEGFLGFRTQSEELEKAARELLEEQLKQHADMAENEQLEGLYNYVKNKKDDKADGFEQMKNHFLGVIKRYNREPTKEFAAITKQIFTGQLPDCKQWYDECHLHTPFDFRCILIRNSKWPKPVHFEWYPLGFGRLANDKEYSIEFHVENNLVEYFNINREFCEMMVSLGYQEGKRNYKFNYSKKIPSEKPILKMEEQELTLFLKHAYRNCINDELINCIDKILNDSTIVTS